MKILGNYWIAIVILLGMSGCLENEETEYERQAKLADEAILTYLQENEIEAEKSSTGIYFEIIEENNDGEQVAENDVVSVVYKMNLLSGFHIETHNDTLKPVKFSHSSNALIPAGLNYEASRMRVGETFRFYLPFYQAFDEYSHKGLFGPYANFIVDMTLVAITSEDDQFDSEVDSIKNYIAALEIENAEELSSGLFYIEEEEGDGAAPSASALVELDFTRKYLNGNIIETTEGDDPLTVRLGQDNLVKGFEEGVRKMKKGGKAILIMPSEIAFGKSVQVIPQKVRQDLVVDDKFEPKTLPYTPIIYEVELLDIK